ncbi:tRNA uridine-5-carboxymethylaminomethyl(34) synthesis GTPase MnmE [Candidatus Magnetominusculus xianensis]|uniref:tRNA modification GTPase MnmE n=1 Tax=Candidatus Magnetominusculus xianensis TaxID=1748249 RepID=A0ABR5SDU5_9BACT|nr:tRNA uridine-5-carboxymethylaminomethyl(34) synthesis GTPase MnmE [Candidatus Magnetominusculus xianensis]KWT83467.1 tRNA modification GTPase MnmE [Candidatus Magnetominusculus xianensis]MBF0404107.1 tRNA uridine-5-carboxymethylaminomethyl(34) synthesis GTPase MnmE [Nitrospirota bacterium]
MSNINLSDDTIAGISTPHGVGGIGIVRISGGGAINIAERIFSSPNDKKVSSMPSFTIAHGFIIDPETGEKIDEVLLSVMRAPKTYTAEDVAEINCHGGLLTVSKTLEISLNAGARLAAPGEFTMRAFLNGRIDLAQAEAVLDIINAATLSSGRLALEQLSGGLSSVILPIVNELISMCAEVEAQIDFPEDDIEPADKSAMLGNINSIVTGLKSLSESYSFGRFYREGLCVAIVGKPNVGKSSLLNALLKKDRAIVTPLPGTTRDTIEEALNIKGLPVRIVDTAGIREGSGLAETQGITRSIAAIEAAALVIAVFDGSTVFTNEDEEILRRTASKDIIIAINKADKEMAFSNEFLTGQYRGVTNHDTAVKIVNISALTGFGLDALKETLYSHIVGSNAPKSQDAHEGVIVTNLRHKTALDEAVAAMENSRECLRIDNPYEITALELRTALNALGRITGTITTGDILEKIFSDFCIGK